MSAIQEPTASTQQFNSDYAEFLRGTPLVLGAGRYGRVYQCDYNGRTVAVKDIILIAKEPERRERLLREGKIHLELRHRNIITLFDTHTLLDTHRRPQSLLLVMELAAGGSLADVLKQHSSLLQLSTVTDWAAQIAEGMVYLLEKDIVHRDLKPANILVLEPIDNSGLFSKTLKIADFGLACDGHEETRTMSEAVGTIVYMAPEVLEEPHRFSKTSDVYSFGMVVWSLLIGKEPSKGLATSLQVEKNPGISPFYDALLKRCCATEHWKRPTFSNILREIISWQRQNAIDLPSITLSNREASSSPPPSQQQQQSFSFGAASAIFKLPVSCQDVALTQDGRSMLLAAWRLGLIELSCTSGGELSRWRPLKPSSSLNDRVVAVAALSDGRAAASLFHAQLVVLLRRNEKSSGSSSTGGAAVTVSAAAAAGCDDAWTEDRRIQLPWRAYYLSAHGDVLVACEWLACLHGGVHVGRRLQLLSVSSGRRLSSSELQRYYEIRSLAVAAHVVVTGSYKKVKLGGGRRAAYVLDAHSIDADGGSDKRLWRHVLNSSSNSDQQQQQEEEEKEEQLRGICADSSGGCLYAAVCRSDYSSGRVSALSLADGTELQRFALSFRSAAAPQQQRLLPIRLSLCDVGAAEQQLLLSSCCCSIGAAEQQQQLSSSRRSSGRVLLLAALCWDSASSQWNTVTLHRSLNAMPQ